MSKLKPASFSSTPAWLRLAVALFGQVDVDPAGESVFLVPRGFAVADEH